MTDLERVRKAYDLVCTMRDAFHELTNEYWHDSQSSPMDISQLNAELGDAERKAKNEVRRVEEETIHFNSTERSE